MTKNRQNINLIAKGWVDSPAGPCSSTRIRGAVYRKDIRLDGNSLAEILPPNGASSSQWTDLLPDLNGFHAIVREEPGRIIAAVDHIRSFPLFYADSEGEFFLSDNAEWVRQQVGDITMDPIACEEFQLTGYVTGPDTLFPNVKQLQAGECLIATEVENGVKVERLRYFRLSHTEPEQYDEPALLKGLDTVVVASIQRLIDYAGGRQIAVPLSGGYDSRLIVTLLKCFGYSNVIAFTYGVPGNRESEFSKRVADALGIRWHFVEYNRERWRQAWQTNERWQYQQWASSWTTVAYFQEWLAVWEMKINGVVDDNCIYVTGHCGDFLAGSHIPFNAFINEFFFFDNMTDAVFQRHYLEAPIQLFEQKKDFWQKRIFERCERDKVSKAWMFADGVEKWDWQERQAKYIGNSVRAFEFFGYDWWMPLWDLEFVKFWESVPLELRKGREWYSHYVSSVFARQGGGLVLGHASDSSGMNSILRRIAKKFMLLSFARKIKFLFQILTLRRKDNIFSQAHFLLSGYPPPSVRALAKKGYTVIGIHSKLSLIDYKYFIFHNVVENKKINSK